MSSVIVSFRIFPFSLVGLGTLLPLLLTGCGDKTLKIKGISEWAQAVADPDHGQGACHAPDLQERPEQVVATLRSRWYPLSVHALESDMSAELLRSALASLEWAYTRWKLLERPWPLPDAARGGDDGLDVYLRHGPGPCAQAHLESLATERAFDSGVGYATVTVPRDRLAFEECLASGLVQAVLLGIDPAETETWRQATGNYLAATLLSSVEISPALQEPRSQSWRGWLSESAGARLWLLLERSKHVTDGSYTMAMWERTRQKSRKAGCLANSPHLWQVIAGELRASKEVFDQAMTSLSVTRYFSFPQSTAEVAAINASELPRRIHFIDPPLEPFGSAYVKVQLGKQSETRALQAWLTGEAGVLWSVVAVRLNAQGQELSRVTAPVRHDRKTHLRAEPTTATESMLIVVTNLGQGIPDYDDAPETNLRAATLTLNLDSTPH